jgi:hypothetical protein
MAIETMQRESAKMKAETEAMLAGEPEEDVEIDL